MVPHLMIAGGLMVLCLKQPDFGGAVVLLVLTFTMLFVAGARLHWLTLLSMVGSMSATPWCGFAPIAGNASWPGTTWTSTARISPTSPSSR